MKSSSEWFVGILEKKINDKEKMDAEMLEKKIIKMFS